MIDSVNNNRGYYEYGRINARADKSMENHEKFALGYDSAENDSTKKDDKKSVKDLDGVVVEFSDQSKTQQDGIGSHQKGTANAEEAFDMEQTVERARGFIGNLIKAVTDFWTGIKKVLFEFWNSDSSAGTTVDKEAEQNIVEAVGEEIAEDTMEAQDLTFEEVIGTIEAESEAEAENDTSRPMVARMPDKLDVEETVKQAEELFATAHYVKNSDLLTYYDRSGKIVQLSGTDKNRILQGDSKGGRLV